LATPETEFWDEIQTKVFRVLLLVLHTHLYNFALRFLFLQTHTTSYSFYSVSVSTLQEKGEKPDRKPHPLSTGLRNPNRNKSMSRNLKEIGCS
jgi:hypothetical protein